MRFHVTLIGILLLALPLASADDNQPRVFAGGPAIYGLQISLDSLKLQSADLENRIRRIPSLTVLLILPPEYQPQPEEATEPNEASTAKPELKYPIDFCLPGETVLLRMYVSKHDHEALEKLASDPTFLSAIAIRTIVSELPPHRREQPLSEALSKLTNLPRAKQIEARYRIGQMMADHALENATIQTMVRQYRAKVEREIIARLANPDWNDFARGRLYQFGGPWELTKQQILAIDPGQVRTVDVNGDTYNFAWVGNKMLMVTDPDPSAVETDPTGLGLRDVESLSTVIRPEIINTRRRGTQR